jgi:hypothetical protein
MSISRNAPSFRLKPWELVLFTIVGLCIMAACILGAMALTSWVSWLVHR